MSPWMFFLLACAGHRFDGGDLSDVSAYEDAGEGPVSLAGCTVIMVFDNAADGEADWLYYYHYDATGLLVQVDGDTGADGGLDSSMAYHNTDGHLVRRDWDGNRDGHLEESTTYRYDALGQLQEMTQDHHADGTEEGVTTYTWTEGLLREESLVREGRVIRVTRYAYEGAFKVGAASDTNGDGAPEETTTWANNPDGFPLLERFDANGDGVPDATEAKVYDAANNLRSTEKDLGADGVLEYRAIWSYRCPSEP